jgi:hypothetical protein
MMSALSYRCQVLGVAAIALIVVALGPRALMGHIDGKAAKLLEMPAVSSVTLDDATPNEREMPLQDGPKFILTTCRQVMLEELVFRLYDCFKCGFGFSRQYPPPREMLFLLAGCILFHDLQIHITGQEWIDKSGARYTGVVNTMFRSGQSAGTIMKSDPLYYQVAIQAADAEVVKTGKPGERLSTRLRIELSFKEYNGTTHS